MCRDSNRVVYAAMSQAIDLVNEPHAEPWLVEAASDLLRRLHTVGGTSRQHYTALGVLVAIRDNIPHDDYSRQELLALSFVYFENLNLGRNYLLHHHGWTPRWANRYAELFDNTRPVFDTDRPRVPSIDELFGNAAEDDDHGSDDNNYSLPRSIPGAITRVQRELQRLRIGWSELLAALQHSTHAQLTQDPDTIRSQVSVTETVRQGFSSSRLARNAATLPRQSAQPLPESLVGLDMAMTGGIDTVPDDRVAALLTAIARHKRRLFVSRADTAATSETAWLRTRPLFRELCRIASARGIPLPRDVISVIRSTLQNGSAFQAGETPTAAPPEQPLSSSDREMLAAAANLVVDTSHPNRKRRSISI